MNAVATTSGIFLAVFVIMQPFVLSLGEKYFINKAQYLA